MHKKVLQRNVKGLNQLNKKYNQSLEDKRENN
jgi:hypothetical protein